MPPPSSQTTATLMVNKETGAIAGPVTAEQFASANELGGSGTPEAHAASHASGGDDPVTLAQSQITNLTTDLAGKAASVHTHAQSDVTNLTTDLAGKQPLATVLTNTTAAFTTAQETKLAGIESGAQANVALASQAEAEAGVETTKTMTPVRVAQAIAALTPPGGVTSVDGQTGAVDTGYDERIAALETAEPAPTGSRIVSGGAVSLTGGLTVTVGAAVYNILGVAHSSVETVLTATTADATHPRYDVIALDADGTAVLIAGTPAASPVLPNVDPATQLFVSFVSIPAGATSITGTVTTIYDSNDDYTMSESGGHVVLNSSNNPRGGSGVCIEATSMVAGDYFQAQTPSGTIDLGTFNILSFFIRNKAAWHSSKQISITARLNGVQVGNPVVLKHGLLGFDQTNTTTYQLISFASSLFGANGQAINQIRWTCAGGGSAITGFYVDDITLQAGVGQVTDSTRLRDRGEYSSTALYDPNDLAYTGSIIYRALQPALGIAQTVTTHWTPFAARALALGSALQVRRVNAAGTAEEFATLSTGGGTKTLMRWKATDGMPPASNYATWDQRNARDCMDFDASTAESLLFAFKLPQGADLSSGIRVITEWKATSATSGNIGTATAFERGNTDSDADSFATAVNSAAVAISGTSGVSTFVTTDHSASEIDGLLTGESGVLKVARNTSVTSNHSGDAELFTVEIQQIA